MTEKINNSSNTYISKVDKVKITSADNVTICITNHIIDVTVTRKRNTKGFSDIEKIDKDHYVVKSTGEIKEYAHVEKSQEMIASNRRKSMNKKFSYLRQYINMNLRRRSVKNKLLLLMQSRQTIWRNVKMTSRNFGNDFYIAMEKWSILQYLSHIKKEHGIFMC